MTTVGFEIVLNLFREMASKQSAVDRWNVRVADRDVEESRRGYFLVEIKSLEAWTVLYHPVMLRWILQSPEIVSVVWTSRSIGFYVACRTYWFESQEDKDEWPQYQWWLGSRNGGLLCSCL